MISAIEVMYKPEITEKWQVANFVVHGDEVLVQWKKELNYEKNNATRGRIY